MGKIFQRQLKALNKKNWLIYKRNKSVILGELLLPLIIMIFIVSIRKVAKPMFNKEETYEQEGFYADQTYTDEQYVFKSSPFDCPSSQAVGIIGSDPDQILAKTLSKLHKESQKNYSDKKEYKTIAFENTKEFYNYIRQYRDVEEVPKIPQLWYGLGISREGKTYNLLIHSIYINSADKVPFEQGDTVPKVFGGFNELKTSHLSTVTVAAAEVIAEMNKNKEHEFNLAFIPKKTAAYHSDMFSSGMAQTFPPLVVVIFLIPFMNFFQKALEEKVNKIKEYMRMMGMKDSSYNTSWVIYYTLQIIVVWLEMTIVTSIYLAPHSSFLLIFLFYFMYSLSLFGWIVSLVAMFNNVKTGSAAALIIHFATYYFIHLVPKAATHSQRCLASLLPNLALTQGSDILWKLEENEIGLTFASLSIMYKNYNISTYFLLCLFNFFLYSLLGLYLTYVSLHLILGVAHRVWHQKTPLILIPPQLLEKI